MSPPICKKAKIVYKKKHSFILMNLQPYTTNSVDHEL